MKYKQLTERKRGFLNEKGHHRTCMTHDCRKMAVVQAVRKEGMWLRVWYCREHALEGGVL